MLSRKHAARSWLLGALATSVAGAASPAFAQAAADEGPGTALEEVVVTANKRAENLQDVPITVNVVTEQAMQAANITRTDQLQRLSPTLNYTPSTNSTLNVFVVRGVGTFSASTGLDASVGISIDSAPVARAVGSLATLVDLDRVEVLNGPQGMLFGKNASAGLIVLTTRNPVLGEFSGNGRVVYGNYDTLNVNGTVNIPLGETAAARLSAWRFGHDGVGRSVRTGKDLSDENNWGGRAKLRWQPTDRLDVNLSAERTKLDENGPLISDRFIPTTSPFFAAETALGIRPSNTNTLSSIGEDISTKVTSTFLLGRADYDLGFATLTSITSYRRTKYDMFANPFGQTNPGLPGVLVWEKQKQDVTTQELRITSSNEGPLQYVGGLFYSDIDIGYHQITNIRGLLPVTTLVDESQPAKSENIAAFLQVTYDVTDQLRLIAGGRLSHDKVKGQLVRTNLAQGQPLVPPINGPGGSHGNFSASNSTSDNTPSWRLGAQYRFLPDLMVYATATRGYKAAGIALQNATPATLGLTGNIVAPEIATAYEAGVRSQWFDRRLTANFSVFSETFKNFQVQARPDVNLPTTVVLNAAELRSEGAELDVRARPLASLELGMNAAYTHARFTEFPNAVCSGLPVCRANGTQDLAGWPLSNAPKWVIALDGRYERDIGSLKGTLDFSYRYQSRTVFNVSHNPFEIQGGYGVLNIGAALRTANDQWGVRVYANNVTDQQFAARIVPQPTGLVQGYLGYGAFRTYGVALDYKF